MCALVGWWWHGVFFFSLMSHYLADNFRAMRIDLVALFNSFYFIVVKAFKENRIAPLNNRLPLVPIHRRIIKKEKSSIDKVYRHLYNWLDGFLLSAYESHLEIQKPHWTSTERKKSKKKSLQKQLKVSKLIFHLKCVCAHSTQLTACTSVLLHKQFFSNLRSSSTSCYFPLHLINFNEVFFFHWRHDFQSKCMEINGVDSIGRQSVSNR